MTVPTAPKIYHITHVDNLGDIISDQALLSDAAMISRGGPRAAIGMSAIKKRRLEEIEVECHPGTMVGQYVPFYFCPRSIMLYLLHMGNHPDVTYAGGQRPLLHLEADLEEVVRWANKNGVRWAFSDRNAGTRYAAFKKNVRQLDIIDWDAVAATDFRESHIKEGKQAEFLVYGSFRWDLIERIGACDRMVAEQVEQALRVAKHRPVVSIERGWYY